MGEHRATIIIAAALVLIVGLIAGWNVISSGEQEVGGPITEVSDRSEIEKTTQLSHLSIATSENFDRQKIYVMSDYLKNLTDKQLRMAEVKMSFTDFDGK